MTLLAAAAVATSLTLGGCNGSGLGPEWKAAPGVPGEQVPMPINLLLPREVRIHPFTGTRTFDEAEEIRGVEVRIEAIDAYGDATKAFGDFRFELYKFRQHSADPRGDRLAVWEESLLEPEKNLLHWDNITRTYEFKLRWARPIPAGRRFVLVATFTSPFTQRLFAQRIAVSGK